MLNNIEKLKVNYNKNEIDNIYYNLLSVIGDSMDKVELNDLKRDLCEKYSFFMKIPLTLVFFGPQSCGKSTLIVNTIRVMLKGKKDIDLSFMSYVDFLKGKLIVYENADDIYFHIIIKKSQEIVRTDTCVNEANFKRLILQIQSRKEDKHLTKASE